MPCLKNVAGGLTSRFFYVMLRIMIKSDTVIVVSAGVFRRMEQHSWFGSFQKGSYVRNSDGTVAFPISKHAITRLRALQVSNDESFSSIIERVLDIIDDNKKVH